MNDLVSRSELKKSARQMLTDENPTTVALLKMFDEIVDNTVPADNWIPVSDRLPDEDGDYFCTVDYGDSIEVMQRYYYKALGVFERRYKNNDTVIAWMPLPEAYKETDNDN